MFMRVLFLILIAAFTAAGQVTVVGAPRVDGIEFYGLRTVTPQLAQQALGVTIGDPLPESKGATEERLLDIDAVVNASLEAVCCEGGKTILYVGIEERGAPHYQLRAAPGGSSLLPEEIVTAFHLYEQAAQASTKTGEDLSKGYALSLDLPTRATQQRFLALADAHLDLLREALRDSADDYHRSIAAYLLPYAAKRGDLVEDLRQALTDADGATRAHAVRGLTALAMLGKTDPASRVRVPASNFVEMLQSLAWTDRMEAVRSLELLTLERDVTLLGSLRGAALTSLIEMARWQTEAHAYPAFQLVGRVAGLNDADIRDAWR
ncbi:MAG: hypothetical protein RL328_2389, partial [Acidobacteriota bacterium]